MNRAHRTLWNASLGSWVAAPETARRLGGGRSGAGVRARALTSATLLLLAAPLCALVSTAAHAQQNLSWSPTGPNSGGSGPWDTTTSSWYNGTVFSPWTNSGNSATLAGVPGTLTLAAPISVQNLTFSSAGYAIQGGTLTLLGAGGGSTITTSGGTDTLSSVLAGGALVRAGTGTLVLTGVNTYTGGTTLNGGTTQVLADSNLGAAAGALSFNGGALATTGSFSSARAITLNAGGGTVEVGSGTALTLSGVLRDGNGPGSLTVGGAGTLTLTGTNTYSGATTIQAGSTLQVGSGGTTGALGSGAVTNLGALIFNRSNALSVANAISGTGTLTQNGTSTVTLSGASSYSGGTTVRTGTLQVSADNNLGSAAGGLTLAGGTLASTAAFSMSRAVVLAGGGTFNTTNTLTLSGNVSGTGPLTKSVGTGTLALNGVVSHSGGITTSAGTLVLGNAGNTFTGGLALNGATVQVATDGSLGDASNALVFNGGTLNTTANLTLGRGFTLNAGGGIVNANSGTTLTLNSAVSGAGALIYNGAGTTLVNGAKTYTGGTRIDRGVVRIVADSGLGDAAGALRFNGGTLAIGGTFATARAVSLNEGNGGGIVNVDAGQTLSIDGLIANGTAAGGLTKQGTGTLVLTGANSYSGGTTLSGGTLQIATNGNLGAPAGGLTFAGGTLRTTADIAMARDAALNSGGGTFNVDPATTLTFGGVLAGTAGGLGKTGSGTLVLTGANTYTTATTISAGTLQVGTGGTTGSLGAGTGGVVNNGALVLNVGADRTLSGVISGTGTLTQQGSGTTVLTGNNSYRGATTVAAGALIVNGVQTTATGATTVASGATLGGTGTIGGSVTVANGGILAPGGAGGGVGTLTLNGGLVLNSASVLNYSFGQANAVGGAQNDLTVVNGGLTLDGTINVARTTGSLFDPGVYRVFSYTGTLTNNTLAVGTLPAGSSATVQTATANQVNLVVSSATPMQYWDGGNAANHNNGAVNGGSGPWQGPGGNANWTAADGAVNGASTPGAVAIFQAAPGTVTVDNATAGQVTSGGMQFAANGYLVDGRPIALAETTPGSGVTTLRVGDGTAAGAGYTATIAAPLQGSTQLRKTDLGTLVLTGGSTYAGGTSITGGTLQLGNGISTGSIVGDVSTGTVAGSTGTLAFDPAAGATLTQAGIVSGLGRVTQIGAGTTVLTGANTYTGGTTLSAGTLQIGDGTTTGSITGPIANNAVLALDPASSATGTASSVISGTGAVQQIGPGTTVLTGANTYTGGTAISAGTLQLGNGTLNGSIVGNVNDNGTLAFAPLNSITLNGVISGTGGLRQLGPGTTSLGGLNTYAGGTQLSGGILQVASNGNLGDPSGALAMAGGTLNTTASFATARTTTLTGAGGTFNVNAGTTLAISSNLTGNGALFKNGDGTLVLTGNSAYTGVGTSGGLTASANTSILAGTLEIAGAGNIGAGALSMGFGTSTAGTLHTTSTFTLPNAIAINPGNGGANFNVDAGTTLTLAGVVSGTSLGAQSWLAAPLVKSGAGTLVLAANNSFGTNSPQATRILAGTLQVGNGGTTGTLAAPAVQNSGTLVFNRSNPYSVANAISGTGDVRQVGSGTTTLTAANSYTGGTTISAGTLQVGADNNLGATSSGVTIDGATLATTTTFAMTHATALNTGGGTFNVATSTALTANGVIANGNGPGAITKTGTGTLVLNAANTYSGGTSINAGGVQVASDANLGAASGVLAFNTGTLASTASFGTARNATLNTGGGILDVAVNTSLTMAGVLSGPGTLTKAGGGTLVLSGANSYGGATTVSGGALFVQGNNAGATGATSVASGATLGGNGTVGGNVVVASGGSLSPGHPDGTAGTLTVNGNLTLNPGASANYSFGSLNGASLNDLTVVHGNLSLGGVLNVSTPAGGSFDPGIYRVFNYDGALTNNGFLIGSVPPATSVTLQTSIARQINLVNTTGQLLAFWDGAAPANKNNGAVNGGDGVWQGPNTGGNDNWTSGSGAANAPWTDTAYAIFQGTPGTVTTNTTAAGPIRTSGMQFATSGYTVTGNAITLLETNAGSGVTNFRVGDGSRSGATSIATIGVVLGGTTQLQKTDQGTLVLTAANTYTGGTAINAGTLQVSANNNLGALSGALSLDGGTLNVTNGFTTDRLATLGTGGGTFGVAGSATFVMTGVVGGVGALTKTGTGILTLTAANSYAGGTAIRGGTLRVASNGNLGAAAGGLILDGGTLDTTATFDSARATTLDPGGGSFATEAATSLTLGGAVSGVGALTKTGTGTLRLTADNSYAGSTTVSSGVLQIGAGGTTGTLGTGSVANAASLVFNRSNVLGVGAQISGVGSVAQSGSGTTVFTADNTYTGGTTIAAGTLQLGGGGTTGSVTGNIVDNAALAINRADVLTFGGAVSGSGRLEQAGTGTTILTGNNTYAGGTTIAAGALQLGNGGGTGAILGNVLDNGALVFNRSGSQAFNGLISGTGTVAQIGTGTTVLGGANSYAGGTRISSGTLAISSDASLGAATGALTFDGGTLRTTGNLSMARVTSLQANGATIETQAGILTQAGTLQGVGALVKIGAGTLVLQADNGYSGGTTIAAGTLQLGNGGPSGSIVGDVADNGTLVFNRNDALTLAGAISGAGALSQVASGITTLSGNSAAFSGTTSVTNGALWINGVLGTDAATLNVANGGTLGGTGTFGGNVTIADGTLAPGNSPGTLTIVGNLALAPSSVLAYEYGQPNVVGGALNDLTVVGGNLTLDGTLNVSASGGGAASPGLYRVISYGGTLTNNGLAIGAQPPGSTLVVQTSVPQQVNVINTAGLALNFWDAGGATHNNGVINGGDGVWQGAAGNDNWADANGAINAPYTSGAFAIFSASPGTVTVDNSLGAVVSGGMQFATSGYRVQGQAISLAAGSNTLRVGDGSAPSAGYVATIASALTGAGGIDKTDQGTLVLTGANSYTGGTTITAGTLQLGNGGSSGSIVGNVVDNGTLAFDRADPVTFDAVVSGTGGVVKRGANALTFTGNNSYTGGTTISGGSLQVGNGGTGGAIAGDVVNNASLVFNRSDDVGFGGVISGTGSVTKLGANALTLTGDHTYTGSTTIGGGTLTLGDGGTTGSIAGDVINNGTLAFNRSDAWVYAGAVSGPGALAQRGPGTTILTGTNVYTGGTTVSGGTLRLGNGGTTGSIVGDVANNGTLVFDRSDAVQFGGVVSGSGAVVQAGAGTTVLTGTNTYGGGTTIAAGTLRISQDANLGAAGGALTLAGGTLQTTGNMATARATTLGAAGALFDTAAGTTLTHTGSVAGSGALVKAGAGTLVLGADATYAGGTTIRGGTLRLGNGGTTGSIAGDVVNNGALEFDRGSALNFAGVISGSGTVTQLASSNLTLSGANSYSGGTALKAGQITIGNGSALGTGALAMDEGTTLGFAADGLNLANALVLTGTTDPVIDTGSFTETLSGVVSGGGGLTKNGSGTLVLAGANTYAGTTAVAAGTLRAGAANSLSAASAHTVAPGATLDTGGFNQRVAALTNSGTVTLLSDAAGSTLKVTGPYVGNGGLLRLGTTLAGSASASDRLVLDGPAAVASGSTSVQITNLNGLGALTTGNGIEVIGATNGATTTAQTSRSAFSLAGGHVDAGAFEYRLHAADALGAGESWYLRSTTTIVPPVIPPPVGEVVPPGETPGVPSLPPSIPPVQIPTYRAEVPLVAALPAQFRQADLAMLGNLHRRMGDEDPASIAAAGAGGGFDAAAGGTRRAWGRLVYADLDIEQGGVAQPRSDGHVSGLQVGTDLFVTDAWKSGIYVGYLDGGADVTGNARGLTARVGRNDLRSRFLGAYATWMDASGWYVDSVLQGASQRYDMKPDINPRVSGKGSSFTASIEGGKAFALSERWSIEPQAQLAWQHSSFDDLVLGGARVQQGADSGWIGRLGVRIKGDLATGAGRLQPYGRLNVYHASFGDDAATFIGPAGATVIASGGGYSAAEVAAGATLALTPATSLYGEIGHLWSLGGDATVKSSVQASLGVKVRW
ncbi:autotransporter-associated beta strand repeat-containing protein [Variovorax sp. GT1P44]|uniref:autotransporter-associated beta strand repeat-containing protein n=1 Tax=Variovorax sp. GT1P44 TaxID=3443742 RepID=UPI003F48D295